MTVEIIGTDEFAMWYGERDAAEQASIERVVEMLQAAGVALEFPYSSGMSGSKHDSMRELRIQHGGEPYRVLYIFDPLRQAVLLMGGVKTGKGNRWYKPAIRLADRLYDEYLQDIQNPAQQDDQL